MFEVRFNLEGQRHTTKMTRVEFKQKTINVSTRKKMKELHKLRALCTK